MIKGVIKLTASCDGKIDKITHKWLVPNNDMDRPHIKVWGKVSESCHLWAAKASIKQHVHDCYMMWSRISLKTTQSNCLELWSRSAHMQKQLDWFVKWPVAKDWVSLIVATAQSFVRGGGGKSFTVRISVRWAESELTIHIILILSPSWHHQLDICLGVVDMPNLCWYNILPIFSISI